VPTRAARTREELTARIRRLQNKLHRVLRDECPQGPTKHRYVKWQADRPPWCGRCGYSRDGIFYGPVGKHLPTQQAEQAEQGADQCKDEATAGQVRGVHGEVRS
jgi:hypothetical protein